MARAQTTAADYEMARDRQIKAAYDGRIEAFARDYRRGRPTVLLLPGGMGSCLKQTPAAYEPGTPLPAPLHDCETIWMDEGLIFFKYDALKLALQTNGGKGRRDLKDHLVVPDGEVNWSLITPYDGTRRYFRDQGYNFAVFGYDWRRSLSESAAYLTYFVNRLRRRVRSRRGEDPLPAMTLLCHSMGGLVAKVFLSRKFRSAARRADVDRFFKCVITVGAPFYGTSDHMLRYYRGQPELNRLYAPRGGARAIAKLVGTMPGPYILMFLDEATYHEYQQPFARLEGLTRYPVRDHADPDETADPYDLERLSRYPPWVGEDCLIEARKMRKTIAKPLPEPVVERLFHIRGVKDNTTWTELSWRDVVGRSYDPDGRSRPIRSVSTGEGDGTVPRWSARLLQTPPSQVCDLQKAKKHGQLTEHKETLLLVHHIIENGQVPTDYAAPGGYYAPPGVSATTLRRFLDDVADGARQDDPRANDGGYRRALMREMRLC